MAFQESNGRFRQRLLPIVFLGWILLVTIARGARWPNDFAQAHWLLDYRFGFVKRALPGSILGLLGLFIGQPSEFLINIISLFISFVFYFTLIFLSIRLVSKSEAKQEMILLCGGFFSSPFIVMAAHTVGYYDAIFILLNIASIFLVIKQRYLFGSLVQTAGVLVHETTMIFCYPIFAVAFILSMRRSTTKAVSVKWLLLLLPFAAFLVLFVSQSLLSREDFIQRFTEHLRSFEFIDLKIANELPVWLTASFIESFKEERALFYWRIYALGIYKIIIPTWGLFIIATWNAFRNFRITGLGILISCLPQLLHLVVWDSERIWTYSIVSIFLYIWVCSEYFVVKITPGILFRLLCYLTLFLNIYIKIKLMDGLQERFDFEVLLLLYSPAFLLLWLADWRKT